jgi:hypothetical protein
MSDKFIWATAIGLSRNPEKQCMIIILCLLFLLFPSHKASAYSISLDGVKLSKIYITFSRDDVVNHYIDFFIKEIKHISSLGIIKQSAKSPKHFIAISVQKTTTVPFEYPSDESKIRDDGFLLAIEPGTILIESKEPLGLVYGLHELMERLGFRYYMPGPYGTVYPSADIHISRQKIISNPAFKYRSVGNGEWSLFAYRANVNVDVLHHDYGRRVLGIFHTFDLLLPEEKCIHEHPEYYAKRKWWDLINNKGKLQLNTANPEVIELVARKLADFSKEGHYEMLTLAPNDHRRFDMSLTSLKMDEWGVPSDQKMSKRMFVFYNEVAKRYKQMGGKLPIRIGAYDVYTSPPKDRTLKLESGLVPYIAHFEYCQLHAIEDKNCKPNKRFAEIIWRWNNLSRNLFIYEYACKRNWLGLPWPVYIHADEDARYYSSKGVIGYFTQFSEENTFPNLLNYYMTAKALWNPSFDYGKIRSEFFSLFYAGVSDKMGMCYKLLEDEFENAKVDISGNARRNFTRIFKEDTLKKALSLAEEAYGQVYDQKVKTRVDMMITWLQYSLAVRHVIEGKDREHNIQVMAYLMKQSEKKGYPIFNRKVLFKPSCLGKLVILNRFLSYYNSY